MQNQMICRTEEIMDNQEPNKQNNNRNNKNGQVVMTFIMVTLVALFIMSIVSNKVTQQFNQEISYTEFLEKVESGEVESVKFTGAQINITQKAKKESRFKPTYYTGLVNDYEMIELLKKHKVEIFGYIPDNTSTWIYNILSFVIPLALVWILLVFLMKRMGGGGVMGVGKTTAKVYVEKSTGVTFLDVAGQDEAKESLQEVVDFLHNPKKYRDIGAKLPKGALLVGPPGTGKTLLAKAVAGEAKAPFFSLAGSDFVEMFVGVGASRVRDLFKEAQKQAPCIIFIDEIDAIGKSRDSRFGGGNDESEQTLNQLLAEMDGFDTSKGLLILAATNRPEVLDKALLRPGRFDRRIIVDRPDQKGRLETLKVHAKDVLMDETVDLEALALATAGLVGSDLANMINEAAINAVKNGRQFVNQSDLFEAFELVAVGGKEKKDRVDDALSATRAAIAEGIVPGGGVAYIRTLPALDQLKGDNDDENTGIQIIRRAIEEPFRQIVENAGVEGAVILQKVKDGSGDFGYNARTGEFENFLKSGVIDPAKVTRVALENAASIAGMFLTTECVIADKKDPAAQAAPMAAPGMGGGMGMM